MYNLNAISSYPHEWCNCSRCCVLRQKSCAHRMASHMENSYKKGQKASKCNLEYPKTNSNDASTQQKATKCYCRATRTFIVLPIRCNESTNTKDSKTMKCTHTCTKSVVTMTSECAFTTDLVNTKSANARDMEFQGNNITQAASSKGTSGPALPLTVPSEQLLEDVPNNEVVEAASRMEPQSSGLTVPNEENLEASSKRESKLSRLAESNREVVKNSSKMPSSYLTSPNGLVETFSKKGSKSCLTALKGESCSLLRTGSNTLAPLGFSIGSIGDNSKSSALTFPNAGCVKSASLYVSAWEGRTDTVSEIDSKLAPLKAIGAESKEAASSPVKVRNVGIVESVAGICSCSSLPKKSTKGSAEAASRICPQSSPLTIPIERSANTFSRNGVKLLPLPTPGRESKSVPLSKRIVSVSKDRLDTSNKNSKNESLLNSRSNALKSTIRSNRAPPKINTQKPMKAITNNNKNKSSEFGFNSKLFEELKSYLNEKCFCGFPFKSNSLKQPTKYKEIKQNQTKLNSEKLEKVKPKAKPKKLKKKAPQSLPPAVPSAKLGALNDICFDCNVPIQICIPISKCIESICNMNTNFYTTSDIAKAQSNQCAGALVKADNVPLQTSLIESACKLCITLCPMGYCPVGATPTVAPPPTATPPPTAAPPTNLVESKQSTSTVSEKALKKKKKVMQRKDLTTQPKELPKQPREFRRQPKEFPKAFPTQFGICNCCKNTQQTSKHNSSRDNDGNMSRLLNFNKTDNRTIMTKASTKLNTNKNKNNHRPLPGLASLNMKSNNNQQMKTKSASDIKEESSPVALPEPKVAACAKQITDPSFDGPPIKLISSEQKTDASFAEPSFALAQQNPDNKSVSSLEGSQASSIKSEALKELLASIKQPIINSIIDANVKTNRSPEETNNQKQSEQAENLFTQLVRKCNSQCEKTFLATQEILKRLNNVDNRRVIDTDYLKNQISYCDEKQKEVEAGILNVTKSVNECMNQMPKQCPAACQPEDEADLISLNSDCRSCRAVKNSLDLKLCRLKQDNDECIPTLVEYSVEAITRWPSKADNGSWKSFDSKCDLLELNESNIEEMMENMKKCCHQAHSNSNTKSKIPLLLLPFQLNENADGNTGTICQPDEWQELDESQLPKIFNSASQRSSECLGCSNYCPEADKLDSNKQNETPIQVNMEKSTRVDSETYLNAREAMSKTDQVSGKCDAYKQDSLKSTRYDAVARGSNQRDSYDARGDKKSQAAARDKNVIVLMKIRKLRSPSRGVNDIDELKSSRNDEYPQSSRELVAEDNGNVYDRTRQQQQMFQQEQQLSQLQQLQAQQAQRGNLYTTLEQSYQQLYADYEQQEQPHCPSYCPTSRAQQSQMVPPTTNRPDCQCNEVARNITESFYQRTLAKYGVLRMPRQFSNCF